MSRARRVAASEVSCAGVPSTIAAAATLAGEGIFADEGILAGAALARPAGFAPGFPATLATAGLRADIDLVPLLDHLVFAQLEFAVGDAFPGLHVVFIAVPRAHEMQFGVGEIEALGGLVRHQPLFDLGNGQSFAGRPALVEAIIAVGVKRSVFPKHADLVVADEHDAAVA